jgi:hypothetical protein
MTKERKLQIVSLLDDIDDKQKALASRLVYEAIKLEEDLDMLRRFPQVLVSAKDSSKVKQSDASKLYEKRLNLYISVIKQLNSLLGKEKEEDELLALLGDFADD